MTALKLAPEPLVRLFASGRAGFRLAAVIAGLALVATSLGTWSGSSERSAQAASPRPGHRILLHVASDNLEAMAHAISTADNAMKFYRARGEPIAIEIVANGSGVRMMRADTSPVAPSIAYLHATYPAIILSACGTTLGLMKAREGRDIELLAGVRVTPAGIARIVELEEEGWTYVRS